MPIKAIAYSSRAVPGLTHEDIERLAARAAEFNMTAGVTGVLFFDGGRFFQYIEGPEDGLRIAYSRIVGANTHTELQELGRGRTGHRVLPYWSMRALPAAPALLATLIEGDWTLAEPGESDNFRSLEWLATVVEPYVTAANHDASPAAPVSSP